MALFTSGACAIKFRPTPGTVPWHKGPGSPEWVDPEDHDINYFVPHFGADSDINASMKNLATAEGELKHEMQASFDAPKGPPMNYFVPHFGEDDDIKMTKENTKQAEAYLGHVWTPAAGADPPPMNYFVPHFGEDTDISKTKESVAMVEKKMGHELSTAAPADPPPRDYFVPHFGEDEDLEFTKRNVASAEKKFGTWDVKRDGNGAWVLPAVEANQYGNYKAENNWPSDQMPSLVQTDAEVESDPICSSAGCTQYKHKKKALGYDIDYPVPHFGTDKDINDDFESIKLAEKMVGHTFQIGTAASKKKWKNPAKDVDYNFAPKMDGDVISTQKNLADAEEKLGHKWELVQLNSEEKAESDPICSSAGCTQYKIKGKKLGYDIDYPVPHFGTDHLINQSNQSLDLAEKMLGHKWVWTKPGDPEDEVVYSPKAMDPDIVVSLENLKNQEAIHGAWSLIQTDSNMNTESDPICSSAGCTQYKHKKAKRGYDINYPVPNLGVDKDITDSHVDLALAEKALSHKLIMGTEASKAKWHNVAKDTDYNFAPKLDGDMVSTAKNLADSETNLGHKWTIALQTDANINTESDPICSSAGCTQYKHKKAKRGYDINYPVPNFGVDKDITDSHVDLALAEKALSHKLVMGTEASKAKWHNVAKDTDYNFAPKLDGDMVSTAKNLADSETNLGHKWTIALQTDADINAKSDPICSSAGCPKSKWTEEEEAKIVQYPDPSTLDEDVRNTKAHEELASDKLGHVWHV